LGLISLLLLMAADQTRVLDPAAKPVAQARVRATTIAGSPVFTGLTDAQGEFPRPTQPNLIVEVEAAGFALYRGPLQDEIRLTLEPVASTLHVTASPGAVEAEGVTRTVEGPHAAAALAGTPGVLLQQTGTSQVSPFLRGLTGYQVLNLIDGVRFNNSTFRSGPNQYLAFVEPSQAERIEAVLGPTSAQYGSDALGGTLQLFTPVVRDGVRGEWNVFAASADLSAGTDAKVSFPAGSRISLLAGVSGRKHNDLRAGQGTDSRHALRRFLGLNPSQIRDVTGSRQQDTGFTQYGLHTKMLARLSPQQWLSAWYQHSRQDNVRNSKDLWGGLGRLQSALAPQGLDFGYLRYERLALGALDSVSATFSVNSQRDGTVRQGLRTTDAIIVDVNRVDSYGWSSQASTRWTARHQLVFGGELYQEQISATRLQNNRAVRPLYPDASRYRNGGAFLQDRWQLGRLRLNGGLRWTGAGYRTREDTRLGVAASQQSFGDLTFNASALWQATSLLGFHATIGRGFRAPNANDLGAVGLNDLGYEVPASLAVPAGALLGNNAGEAATSLGRAVTPLAPERLFNYEAGLRLTTSRFEWRTQLFLADLYDPIVRRTLLFSANAAPREVAGLPVTLIAPTAAQRAQGVVTVASAFDARALKAFVNDGRSRYYGIESTSRYQLTQHWTGEASYAFLVGRDLLPNRNIRRLPPQQGLLRLRYTRSRWWMSVWSEANGAQRRLSGGDFDDERIGASRSRADIEAFWNGARLGGVSPTGETLAQIQNRLLPGLANNVRVPLYNSTAGWVTLNTAAGFSLTDRVTLSGGVNNWLDRNYRFHGSGIDAPGLLVSASLRYRF
jgi:hemoglobin/transferrin/lactoferrin receptor protein